MEYRQGLNFILNIQDKFKLILIYARQTSIKTRYD